MKRKAGNPARLLSSLFIWILLLTLTGWAYYDDELVRHSLNGRYTVRVERATERRPCWATLTSDGNEIWSCALDYRRRPKDAEVSNDGQFVAFLNDWEGQVAVSLHGDHGQLLWRHKSEEVRRQELDTLNWYDDGRWFDLPAGELVVCPDGLRNHLGGRWGSRQYVNGAPVELPGGGEGRRGYTFEGETYVLDGDVLLDNHRVSLNEKGTYSVCGDRLTLHSQGGTRQEVGLDGQVIRRTLPAWDRTYTFKLIAMEEVIHCLCGKSRGGGAEFSAPEANSAQPPHAEAWREPSRGPAG